MIKIKYLHRSARKSRITTTWKVKKFNRKKKIDISSELPFHEKISKSYKWSNYDFTPLYEFIESKIGQDWNDVYSEMLTKVKKRFRHCIENGIKGNDWRGSWLIKRPIYDEKFIPRDSRGRMLENAIYIDFDNIIRKQTKDEILKDSLKHLRRLKIQQILNNQENNQ